MSSHDLFSGRLQLFKRPRSRYWQCGASFKGRQFRVSTKHESFAAAQEFAEDWYLTLLGKARAGILKGEKTFAEAAEQFLKEYVVITEGQRSPRWVEGHGIRLRLHLLPFFGEMGLSEGSVYNDCCVLSQSRQEASLG